MLSASRSGNSDERTHLSRGIVSPGRYSPENARPVILQNPGRALPSGVITLQVARLLFAVDPDECIEFDSDAPSVSTAPLPLLNPGPWISTGRVLNYEFWEERERFKELDRLIAAATKQERENRERQALEMTKRGVAPADIARKLCISKNRVQSLVSAGELTAKASGM